MTKRVVAQQENLKTLVRCKSEKRKKILEEGGKDLQLCLRECAVNILNGTIPLTPNQYKKLEPYKDGVRRIALYKTTQKERRDIEQNGGFLPALLAPVVGAVLGALLKKK